MSLSFHNISFPKFTTPNNNNNNNKKKTGNQRPQPNSKVKKLRCSPLPLPPFHRSEEPGRAPHPRAPDEPRGYAPRPIRKQTLPNPDPSTRGLEPRESRRKRPRPPVGGAHVPLRPRSAPPPLAPSPQALLSGVSLSTLTSWPLDGKLPITPTFVSRHPTATIYPAPFSALSHLRQRTVNKAAGHAMSFLALDSCSWQVSALSPSLSFKPSL